MASIFVQMASYHDYEINNTIDDLFSKSSGENIIHVGVSITYYQNKDYEVLENDNIKVLEFYAPDNIGVGNARYSAHTLYNGEDYYFQVDSHSIFDKDWDKTLISYIKMYQDMGIEKPALTGYPRNYWYDSFGEIQTDKNDEVHQISFHEDQNAFRVSKIPSQTADSKIKNQIFANTVSGGCIFTVGNFITPHKKSAFWGEEIITAARAFTRGYDLMLLPSAVMCHLYYNHQNPESNKRRQVWQDFPDEFAELDQVSRAEVKRILEGNVIGEQELGSERALEEYSQRCGLNFITGKVWDVCGP